MGRKLKYQKKGFESMGGGSDTSANIYMSMLLSPAWLDLTANQQRLYVACKAQYYGEKKKPFGDPLAFTMNRSKWCLLYKLYTDKNRSSFYRDRDALISHGFVRVLENGRLTRTKTIYSFWDMWQKWGTPEFAVTVNDMSESMVSVYRKGKNEREAV